MTKNLSMSGSISTVELPKSSDGEAGKGEKRGALGVRLENGVWCVCTHFGVWNEKDMEKNIATSFDCIERTFCRNDDDEMIFLGGDLNVLEKDIPESVRDKWRFCVPQSASGLYYSFPKNEKTIDFVLLLSSKENFGGELQIMDGTKTSDHNIIVTQWGVELPVSISQRSPGVRTWSVQWSM